MFQYWLSRSWVLMLYSNIKFMAHKVYYFKNMASERHKWKCKKSNYYSIMAGPSPSLEVVTCTNFTTPWLRRCTTPFIRDRINPLICIFVDKELYCSRIMITNRPQSIARTTWRPMSPDCHGLSPTVTWPLPHWIFLETQHLESRAFFTTTRSSLECCQIMLG